MGALDTCTSLIYLHFTLMWPNADIFPLESVHVNGYPWSWLSCIGLNFPVLERAREEGLDQRVTSLNRIDVTSVTWGPACDQGSDILGNPLYHLPLSLRLSIEEESLSWSCSLKAIPSGESGLSVFGLFLPTLSFSDKGLSLV